MAKRPTIRIDRERAGRVLARVASMGRGELAGGVLVAACFARMAAELLEAIITGSGLDATDEDAHAKVNGGTRGVNRPHAQAARKAARGKGSPNQENRRDRPRGVVGHGRRAGRGQ